METIQGIYIALFGRPADPQGLAYFTGVTNGGADLAAIGNLAGQPEYQQRFVGMSNEEIINSIYQSLFGRHGEAEGVNFFLSKLADGTFNINNIAIAILQSAQGDDLATVNAKIAAASIFTAHLDQQVEIDAYAGTFAASVGRDFINTVTKDDAGTADEADAAILRLFDQGQNPGNGGAPGGGGGGLPGSGPAPLVFVVTEANGVISFSGDAKGQITYSTDGNGVTTFERGGVTAANVVQNLVGKEIILGEGQVLSITGDQADDQKVTGNGSVVITGLDSDDNTSRITAVGTATLDGDVNIAQADWAPSKTVAIEVGAGQTFTLDSEQADGVSISGAGKTIVEAWTFATADNITVLTSGGNYINGGAGGDIIVSGAGDDVLDGGETVNVVEGVKEKYTFTLNNVSYANTIQVSDGVGGFANARITAIGSSDDAVRADFVSKFNTSDYGSLYTASVVGSTITIEAKNEGPLADLSFTPQTHDRDTISVTFNTNGQKSGTVWINGEGFAPIALNVSGGSSAAFANDLASKINGNATLDDHVYASASNGVVTLAWLTPGSKATINVTENISNLSLSDNAATSVTIGIGNFVSVTNGTTASATVTNVASVDVLNGGEGADEYRFEASTLTAVDQIVGFNADEDTIVFGTGTGAITYDGEWTVDQNLSLSDAINDLLAGGQSASNQVGLVLHGGKQYLVLDGNGNDVFDEVVDQIVEVTGWSGTLNSADFSFA